MVFRQPQRTVAIPELTIDKNIIDVVDNFSFLGLNINNNLKWENHIDCISIKISRTIGIMKGGCPGVVVSTAAFHARVRGSVHSLGGLKETKMFLHHPRVKVSIVGSFRH